MSEIFKKKKKTTKNTAASKIKLAVRSNSGFPLGRASDQKDLWEIQGSRSSCFLILDTGCVKFVCVWGGHHCELYAYAMCIFGMGLILQIFKLQK